MISNRVLYLVEGQLGGEPIELLAIGVVIDGSYVTFNDTVRPRCFEGHLEEETPDGFVWHRNYRALEGYDVDDKFVFRVLTVERVRPKGKTSGNRKTSEIPIRRRPARVLSQAVPWSMRVREHRELPLGIPTPCRAAKAHVNSLFT